MGALACTKVKLYYSKTPCKRYYLVSSPDVRVYPGGVDDGKLDHFGRIELRLIQGLQALKNNSRDAVFIAEAIMEAIATTIDG